MRRKGPSRLRKSEATGEWGNRGSRETGEECGLGKRAARARHTQAGLARRRADERDGGGVTGRRCGVSVGPALAGRLAGTWMEGVMWLCSSARKLAKPSGPSLMRARPDWRGRGCGAMRGRGRGRRGRREREEPGGGQTHRTWRAGEGNGQLEACRAGPWRCDGKDLGDLAFAVEQGGGEAGRVAGRRSKQGGPYPWQRMLGRNCRECGGGGGKGVMLGAWRWWCLVVVVLGGGGASWKC